VSRSYGEVRAVRDVSLEVPPGQFVTLLGPSGCGKTTLLRLVAGFERPDAGTISLSGRDVTALPAHQRPVNTVFQQYALFPHRTVSGNVAFGLEIQGLAPSEIEDRVARALELVRMKDLGGRATSEISGGQKQRVALARTLLKSPRILILDDSTSSVDTETEASIREELNQLMKNCTTFIIAHRIQSVMNANLILVMDKGQIVQMGTHEELLTQDGMYRKIYDIQTRIETELEQEIAEAV
jgi:ABC-type Fe3+/spermidine/putrescine transport system ATPase subunit